jgi:hypothetical protein
VSALVIPNGILLTKRQVMKGNEVLLGRRLVWSINTVWCDVSPRDAEASVGTLVLILCQQ